eukprot:15476759-Alexandrium_andersonii.AAC.1
MVLEETCEYMLGQMLRRSRSETLSPLKQHAVEACHAQKWPMCEIMGNNCQHVRWRGTVTVSDPLNLAS